MGMAARCPDLLGVVVTEVVVVVVCLGRRRSTLGQPQLRSLKVGETALGLARRIKSGQEG